MSETILVTGAAGNLGKRTLELLLARRGSARIVATTRKPEALADLAAAGVEVRGADFDDSASLGSAFAGVDRALLISTDAVVEPGRRKAQQLRAVDAMARAGVKHVVYTSIVSPIDSRILLSADHAATEAALAKSGLAFTSLRNNMYTDYLLPPLQRAVASGQLIDARENGQVGFVTREDCAAIAAAVLSEPPAGQQLLDVTGPELMSMTRLAALASELSGRSIGYQSIPVSALIAGMVEHGLPQAAAEVYASFDSGIAAGELAVKSDSVERFTGRKPQSVEDFLRATRAVWAA